MTLFGDYYLELDPWDVEYGSEIPIDPRALEASPSEHADTTVETKEAWRAIRAGDGEPPREIVFVDGVRRADARVVLRKHATPSGALAVAHGIFGTFAVGSVRL